jgi:hypothetical protein
LLKRNNNIFEGVKAMYLFETNKNTMRGSKYAFSLVILLGLILFAGNSVSALPADTVVVIARHPESGERSTYQINFQVSTPIPAKAIIRVTFPDEFDLSDLIIAGSTTINGGFDLSVNKQVVTMKRSGLGREIPANEKVDVKFAIVKNPGQPSDNYKIVIEILDAEEKSFIRSEKFQKILPAKK